MRRAVKRAGLLVTLSTLVAVALPGTASAAEVPVWVKDPSSCTGVTTVAEKALGDRFLQLRKGWCGRAHYVWARANGNFTVEMGVWRGDEHIGTNRTQNGSGSTHYTQGRRIDSNLWFITDTPWTTPISWG